MPLYYAYLTQLLYLPGLLCLLLSSMPTQSLASTCMELICQVILPSVLPIASLLLTVPSAVFMYSTYIIVSYAYLVCYDYILFMPIHVASIAYLVSYGLPCYACPVSSTYLVFYNYAWSAVPTCLSGDLCLILYNIVSYALVLYSISGVHLCLVMPRS